MNPSFRTTDLIAELEQELHRQRARCAALRALPVDVLRQRPAPGKWSVLEVLEHIVLSSGHYRDRLLKAYARPHRFHKAERFIAGRWGAKFTEGMRPLTDGSITNRMRTLWFFEPRPGRVMDLGPLDRCEQLIDDLLRVLGFAAAHGWEGPRITSTLGPVFRFKVGDAVRFPVAHQQRHFLQIDRTLEAVRAQAAGTLASA